MNNRMNMKGIIFLFFLFLNFIFLFHNANANSDTLLNVSYSATQELYQKYNPIFKSYWKKKTGKDVLIEQSFNGSGAQARAVINGLEADVVTLANAYDIDLIALQTNLLPINWQQTLPNSNCPYHSTIVLLVRKDNPKHIKDWSDLIQPGVEVITPNPKTSGGARWNFLATWGYAMNLYKHDQASAIEFMRKLYKNAPILDTDARAAMLSFVQRNMGDVLIIWENEALLAVNKFGKDKFKIIYPSISILTEPPVAVVVENAKKKGTLSLATAYLSYLYSDEGQTAIAKCYFRPTNSNILLQFNKQFPKLKLFTINEFGGWKSAQKTFFDDGGIFDQIYQS